jgi:hypothetical protein
VTRQFRFAASLAFAGLLAGMSAGCGPEKYQNKTDGSEEYMKKVRSGQPMYTPPPGAIKGPTGPSTPGAAPAAPAPQSPGK